MSEVKRGMGSTPLPIPMILYCPACGVQHIDSPAPEKGWTNPSHKSHLCAVCGTVWRPCDLPTTGVRSISTRGDGDTWPGAKPASNELTLEFAFQELAMDAGASVTILSPNDDYSGPAYGIDVCGHWTGWEEKRFTSDVSTLACLRDAVAAKRNWEKCAT